MCFIESRATLHKALTMIIMAQMSLLACHCQTRREGIQEPQYNNAPCAHRQRQPRRTHSIFPAIDDLDCYSERYSSAVVQLVNPPRQCNFVLISRDCEVCSTIHHLLSIAFQNRVAERRVVGKFSCYAAMRFNQLISSFANVFFLHQCNFHW